MGSAAVIPVRWQWPWAAQAIQALAKVLCFWYVPAWCPKLVPPTRLAHPSCSAALAHLQAVVAKHMESQSGCKEVWELGWKGGMWGKDKGYGLERCRCRGTVRVMRAWCGRMGVLRKADAGGDKNGVLCLYWFRLLRIFRLCQKVFFCLISKYTGDLAFKSCILFSIAKG